jgi:ribosomal protein L11 methyltransferase
MNNTQKNWFAVEIETKTEAAEAVEFALNELDALGTEINNLGVKASETLRVVGYFNELPDDETVRFQLDEALNIYGFSSEAILNIDSRAVENADWLAEWKKRWKPTETEKFIIAPPWETVENTGKIVIKIEPSMAFGTGTHDTTKLCLQAIEKHFSPEMSFFDVGTGTGILAIAAAKFAAKNSESQITNSKPQILGCDTDEDSIKIARENAELNETPDVGFYVGSIDEETPKFDFVCANITIDVIIPILPQLLEKAEKILALSGILKEQENQIVTELEKFEIKNPKIETSGEWISVIIDS